MNAFNDFGLSELLQSGILVTLITIAWNLGQTLKKLEVKSEDHERRISKIEDRIY